jgi:hypothetical protein
MKMPAWIYPVSIVAGVTSALLALFGGLWAVFCFIGGPDGKFGSRESIVAGTMSLSIGVFFVMASIAFFKAAVRKDDQVRPRFYTWTLKAAPLLIAGAAVLLLISIRS